MSKAGRPKKGSAGLPKWFDIEKYRVAQSYGTAEWFQQLAFRFVLDDLASSGWPWPYSAAWSDLVKADPNIALERVTEVSTKEPPAGPQRDLARASKVYMIGEMTISATFGNGVRPINYGEIEEAYLLTNAGNRLMAGFKKQGTPDKQDVEEIWLAKREKPYHDNRYGRNGDIKYLRVDLSLPSALLKRDFAEYIKSQAKDAKELQSPFFQSQDFLVWYDSGVLPYLDLRLWEMELGQTFRWSDFADALNAITNKPVGSEDACRKAAKSHARKLLDERTIRMLKFQAIKEQDGSRKKSGKLFVK